jgi:hypothetical protein
MSRPLRRVEPGCWSHPHNRLEAEAFESLEARGATTTPLLRKLFEGAHSTCTIRSTAHILARRKVDGLFDELVQRLPGDLRLPGMEMDIAGSLDDLGDPRAVEPLRRVLDSCEAGAANAQEFAPLQDRAPARARAALALGAFDVEKSRRALEAGTKDPLIAPYCLAALYRLTRDPARLTGLERSIGPDDSYRSYVVGHYLIDKVGTEDAKMLARKWEEQCKAQRAKEQQK